MTNIDPLQLAVEHHEAGRLDLAEKLYREIIASDPRDADTLHLLGLLVGQQGRNSQAIEFIARAIAIDPNALEFFCNYGEFSRRAGNLPQAIDAFTKAIAVAPNSAEAHYNLGVALAESNELDRAIAALTEAARISPTSTSILTSLGFALRKNGCVADAIGKFKSVIQIDPKSKDAWLALAASLRETEQLEEAIAAYRKAIGINPANAEAHNNLANLYKHTAQLDAAIDHYTRAISLKPDLAQTHNNLATVLRDLGRLDDAIAESNQAIALLLNPSPRVHEEGEKQRVLSDAYTNQGNCLKDQCLITEALAAYSKAIELNPDNITAGSSRLYTLHLYPTCSAQTLLVEHQRWAARHAEPLRDQIQTLANDRSPNRRIRLGYISPDFRDHAVGRMLMPLLANHDHEAFEIVCYSDTRQPDEITHRAKSYANQWHEIAGITDENLAEQIRRDRIDILIDLAAHTAGNRLLVFARKPAPVQLTWLGCPTTTGLSTIDYRLTDPYLDPPGQTDGDYTEKTSRVPRTIWCFEPQPQTPPVNALPARTSGYITFGSLNNFAKLNNSTLNLWIDILQAVPNSRLLIKSPAGSAQTRVRALFQSNNIVPGRLEFIPKVPAQQYYSLYHRIDVGLDPTPYNGHTTTFDYLWMGVPVVTLAGQTCVGRGGESILSNLNLPELIARTPKEYINAAVRLAGDLPKLIELRTSLRQRMLASPLMDAVLYARDIEVAYRKIWLNWCRQNSMV